MLPKESLWIGETIRRISAGRQLTLLNVGSSTAHFRTVEQPIIDRNIFKKLPAGLEVVHLDIKDAPGVDIVGNLMDDAFLDSIREQFDIILCSNLLEHVDEPQKVINRLQEIVKEGGYLVVTGPKLFPYHNDPIDNMFRPSVNEMAAMFKKCQLVDGAIIVEDGNHFGLLKASPVLAMKVFARMLLPFYKYETWRKMLKGIPHFFKKFEVVAVLLQKKG